jgi:hypothetical protein
MKLLKKGFRKLIYYIKVATGTLYPWRVPSDLIPILEDKYPKWEFAYFHEQRKIGFWLKCLPKPPCCIMAEDVLSLRCQQRIEARIRRCIKYIKL